MKFWRRRSRHPADRPDIESARAELERVKSQRPEVDALVDALVMERKLNNFTANVVVTFRGGRS